MSGRPKRAASSAAATATSPAAASPATKRTKSAAGKGATNAAGADGKHGIAVVGYGRMGLIHAGNVAASARLRLVSIVGRNKDKAAAAAAQICPQAKGQTLEEALADPEVQGFVIASGTTAHFEQIVQIAKAKKPIFCDKPIALSVRDIEESFSTAAANGVELMCGYQRRFDPHFQKAKEIIASGKIGKVHIVRMTSRDHPAPPAEVLLNLGSFFDDFSTHDVDTARWLLGEDPSEIYAVGSGFLADYKGKPLDDTAVLVLRFPSGAMCVIDNSRRAVYGYDIRCEVLGSEGMVQVQNPRESEVVVSNHDGLQADKLHYSFPQRFAAAYKNELSVWENFLDGKLAAAPISVHDCT
jgi:myo-inositol 2-dehydrogenase/D-chiro-inositol 1-dehydrogenase